MSALAIVAPRARRGRAVLMCGCEPGFTCSRCAGTRFDPRYPELLDDGERDREARGTDGARETSEDE